MAWSGELQVDGRILADMTSGPFSNDLALRARASWESPWTWLMSSKAPEVTVLFWLLKILSTTGGAAATHFFAVNLALGLVPTTAIMGVLLVTLLSAQISLGRHVAPVFWLTVLLVGAMGSLLADNLLETLHVRPATTSAVCALGLGALLMGWYRTERTLSIHTIVTRRREAFYWLAVLLAFALGTASGELAGSVLPSNPAGSVVLLGAGLVALAVGYFGFGTNAVATFWAAYVLTGPFGESAVALLGEWTRHDGLGLGGRATGVVVLALAASALRAASARRG